MTHEQRTQIISARRNGVGYATIAKEVGMTKNAVAAFCRRNGLTGNTSIKNENKDGFCRECGKPIVQTAGAKAKVFCSRECGLKWWHAHPEQLSQKAVYEFQCACCGKAFTSYGNAGRKYCSHECYINARFRKGGGNEQGRISD